MIPAGFVQDLLTRVDIVDVVGRHVTLKKAGINHKGLCPFHGEKTPSFIVSPSRQTYHCFGCGAHGDAIRFLVDHGALAFPDAVRELAGQLGLAVPEDDASPDERARATQARERRATLVETMARAAAHYRDQLKASTRAVAYLKGRGLTGQVAARFALGYAPPGPHALASAFADYDDPLLTESGLVIDQGEPGQEQRRRDRFRDRIMFPLRSVRGDVVGFGGRVLDRGEPKYLNSPETPAFSKGRELYGLFEARRALRTKGCALVVEGYMDVVALAQNGLANAVATLGTACTAEHLQLLFRHTDDVVFAFDGDAAGRKAAARALEAALPHATDLRSVRFLFLPPEHDPDSFIRSQGLEAFERELAAAVPLSRQLIEHAARDLDLTTAEGRARMLALARPLWAQLPVGTLRDQLLHDLAARSRLDTPELAVRWGQAGPGAVPVRAARAPLPPRRASRIAPVLPWDQAARIVLQHCELWLELPAQAHHRLVALPGWHGELFGWVDRQLADHDPPSWPDLREALAGTTFGARARSLVDDAVVLPEATLEALLATLAQGEAAERLRDAAPLLGRL